MGVAWALSSYGALRSGAGLVTLAMPASQLQAQARRLRPEAMSLALPETQDGACDLSSVSTVLQYISARKVSALVLGPGLSRSMSVQGFVRCLLDRISKSSVPLKAIVLDADGFLALSGFWDSGRIFQALPIIVTPHPGEMAAFLNVPTAKVQENRLEFALKFCKLWINSTRN